MQHDVCGDADGKLIRKENISRNHLKHSVPNDLNRLGVYIKAKSCLIALIHVASWQSGVLTWLFGLQAFICKVLREFSQLSQIPDFSVGVRR